jgi:hypothetical protein
MESAEAEIDAKFKSTTVYQWCLIFGTFMGVFNFKIKKSAGNSFGVFKQLKKFMLN